MKKHYLLVLVILTCSIAIQAQVRWIDSVIAFSSESLPSPGNYSVAKVIGNDPYPVCGLDSLAWQSAASDDQREFLVVHFGGIPAPVNDISIYQNNSPGAIDTVYLFNPNTSLWETIYTYDATQTSSNPIGPCAILRIDIPTTTYNVSMMRVAINSPAVNGYNEISSISIQNLQSTTRWVDSVYSVSSELTSDRGPWSSWQVTGLPNTYPLYGDIGNAWESSEPDHGEESLVLHFSGTPQPAQGVNIYETYKPGAIDSIYGLDGDGNWQLLWSNTAQIAPDSSRILHAVFPKTTYNVSFIRLTLNSAAVPGFNEIDAVSLVDTVATLPNSIIPVTANINFLLYPNPAQTELILQVSEAAIRKQANLLTVQGQLLSQWQIETPLTYLPVSNLPAGIYLVKIDGTVQRFIKQ